jgi:hypothetical protein
MLQDDSIPYSVSKRVKDSDLSDTSSESTEDDRAAKMEKMSQAFKTILEVSGAISMSYYHRTIVSNLGVF